MSLFSRLVRMTVPTIAFAIATTADADTKQIKLGTTSGPDTQIWKVVQKVTKEDGPGAKIIEFSDYAQPNPALDSGNLDADGLQHQPSLDNQIQTRHYKIVNVGLTYVAPVGFYSRKIKSLTQLKEGAKVGIQNDPSNGNRTLLLLRKIGVIKLKVGAGTNGSDAIPRDVVENLKKIKLVEPDSAQLSRLLDDLGAASISTDYAVENGLTPTKDVIAPEDRRGPYTSLIAVREKDKDQPWVKTLVRTYRSEGVRRFIDTQFKGTILPAF